MAVTAALTTGCVKIETGQTVAEATESNEFKARQIRSEWATQLHRATPIETAQLVKRHIDSVSAMYLRYGLKVAEEWRKGNEGRGQAVDAGEMRQVVDAWVEAQKPILNAYEDNLEFGLDRIKESRFFAGESLTILEKLMEQFYANRSIVFYPNQDVGYYEFRLTEAQKSTESLSRELGLEIGKY